MRALCALVMIGAGALPAIAQQTTYTYTGGQTLLQFSNGAVSQPATLLSASFQLPQPIGPNKTVSVTPAVYLVSPPGAPFLNPSDPVTFNVTTDAKGNITSWNFSGSFNIACDCGSSFVSVGYDGVSSDMLWTTKAFYPPTVPAVGVYASPVSVAQGGFWTTNVSTAGIDGIYCIEGQNIFEVMPISNTLSLMVRANASSPKVCYPPDTEPSSWYIQITTNGGESWSWVTLASLGLGK